MAGILLNRSRQVPAEETPAFGGIAERFRRAGDLDRAIALCRDGLKRFPEQLSARVTLGWALLDKGQYDAARVELEYVLRKAPDNLAAIRGLAELHDRTEGALPADDSSWKSDESATVEAAAPAVAEAPVPVSPLAQPAAAAPTPIPVSFQSTGAEVLHTAAQAELDAATSVSFPMDSHTVASAPVELEDAASASLHAAEPAPFFVDAAGTIAFDVVTAADVVPVPFEVPTVDEVHVELETPGAAALAAVDESSSNELDALTLKFGAFTDIPTTAVELSSPADEAISHVAADAAADWAGLTALSTDTDIDTRDATSCDELPVAAFDAGIVSEESGEHAAAASDPSLADLETTLELEAMSTAALDENGEHLAAVFEAPQGLDDVDEAAGQELADAIRALEEAAKRVEAKLAPPPVRAEPASSPEHIAAFDFAAAAADTPAVEEPTLVDASCAGAFELTAPSLADVVFPAPDAVGAEPDAVAEAHVEGQSEGAALAIDNPAFDFEGVVETELPTADMPAAELDETVPVDAVAGAHDHEAPAAVDLPIFGEWSPVADGPSLDRVFEADDEPAFDAVNVSFETPARDAVEDDPAASVVVNGTDGADVSAVDGTGGGVDFSALFPVADTRVSHDAAEAAAPAAESGFADLGSDLPGIDGQLADVAFGVPRAALESTEAEPSFAESCAPGSALVSEAPVMHVYDVPVFGALTGATTAALNPVSSSSAPADGATFSTTKARQLAGLERFLRQVQARQLELRGETVA